MTIDRPTICTREQVKAATDIAETARANDAVDRAIVDATAAVTQLCHRSFHPITETRTFDWPNDQHARTWRLWLDENELVSVATLTAGGTTIPASDYFLEPANSGPPYNVIEIDLASSAAFQSGDTHQRAIEIAGLWSGCPDDRTPAGTLTAQISSTTATTCSVSDSAALGIGDVANIDTERLLVTGKTMADTGQTVAGSGLTESNANSALTVSGGTWAVGEVLLIGAEKVRVDEVAGTSLVVMRAVDGTVLAAHTAATAIFAPRTLTVVRGVLGSTAATHANGAAIGRQVIPAPVQSLGVAEAINLLQQDSAAWARVVGSGENAREARGAGLTDKRKAVRLSHGRKGRKGAI